MGTEDQDAPGGDGQREHPRYLYHKTRRAPKSRLRTQPSPIAPSPRRSRANPALDLMLANLRRFGVVLVGMILLLVISIMVLKFFWRIRDRELRAPRARPAAEASPAPTGAAVKTATEAEQPEAVTGEPTKGGVDTELIRRAVFLAKHAQALQDSGSYDEAIKRYREALDVWPYLTSVWGQLGRLYLRTRDFPRAQIALEKAVENNPGSAELLNDLGVAYLYQGKVDKAANLFDAAVEVDPQYAASMFNLALCSLTRNDRVAARANLNRYLRMKPMDARALRESAFLDAMETQYDTALASLEKALTQAPDWPLLYFDAAAVSALMGRPDQAIKYLQRAEPLTTPATVYQLYQEPAFREIRLTELGKMFEKELAERSRERSQEGTAVELHAPSEPISSVTPPR